MTPMLKPLDEVLLEFLDGLPATIREQVLASICIQSELVEGFSAPDDWLSPIKEHLNCVGITNAGRLVRLVGLTEVCLFTSPHSERINKEMYEKFGNPVFQEIALRTALVTRHMNKSREKFKRLRSIELRPEALWRWSLEVSHEGLMEMMPRLP